MPRARESFFSLPALALMGALIALALYLLFPRQSVFENPEYLENPDALSIAYLEVLLRSDSDNVPLRMSLATALARTGQLDQADDVLEPLLDQEPVLAEAFELYLELQAQRVFAVPEGPERQRRQDELYAAIQKLLRQPYEPERLLSLLMPMDRWLTQERYLALLQSAQDQIATADQKLWFAREIARLQEAQSRPGAAAATLRPYLEVIEPKARAEFIDNLIRLELASGDPSAALALFKQRQPTENMTEEALNKGITLARLADSPAYEAVLIQRRADSHPGNMAYQRELLASQLGSGRPLAALTVVRRMQRQADQLTPEDRQQIAEVLEWNDLPEEAMQAWASLYRDTGSTQAFRRSTSLARGLFQWNTLLSLLNQSANQGNLQPEGYIELANALVRAGRFETAVERLEQGLSQYPNSEKIRAQLLALHINLRDIPSAIALLQDQPTLSPSERLELASLLWRIREPEQALALLDSYPQDLELSDAAQSLRLELARYLGRTDILRSEYERLLASDEDSLTANQEDRLLDLAVLFEDYSQALRLSKRRFQATGEVRYLSAMAEYQLALEHWQALENTLDRWLAEGPATKNSSRYWSLRARVHERNGNIRAANDAYRTAWQLASEDENLMISWAWLTLSEPGEYADLLQALLARISESPTAMAYPVLAYGNVALGKPHEALRWFKRGMAMNQDQTEWLLGTAGVMEQTGSPGIATNLRQQAARHFAENAAAPASRFAVYREEGLLKQAWAELAAHHRGGDKRDAVQNNLPEAFADFAADQGQAQVTEALVPQVSDQNRRAAHRLEQRLYQTPESRQQSAARYIRQIDQLSTPMAPDQRQQTIRDTVNQHQTFNRAVQVGAKWQNLGNFTVRRAGVTGQFSHDDVRWQGSAHTLSANTSGRLRTTPGADMETSVTVDRRQGNALWSLTASQLPRYETDDLALAAQYDLQWTDRVSLGAGYQFQERTPDSAEAWWLTRRNRAFIATGYTPFSRLNLNLQAEHLAVDSLNSDSLADGYGLDLNATYTLFRNDLAWIVSAGYRKQALSLADTLPDATLDGLDQPLAPSALLTEDYERVGVSTRWFHGEPHALYRSTPSPRVSLGLDAGYVLSSSTPELGVDLGLGWRVLGDDELVLSGRWSSEGLDGNGRTEFNLTYTIYLGR